MSSKCSIDLSVLNTRFPTGISRYADRVFDSLLKQDQSDIDWLALGTAQNPTVQRRNRSEHLPYEFPLHDLGKCKQELSAMLSIESVDAHFSTYYPLPDRGKLKTFLTVFDLLPLQHPEWFPNKNSESFFDGPIRESASKADRIFAISEATKDDLVNIFDVDEERIIVTHLASILNPVAESPEKTSTKDTYFLSVGTLEPRKNLKRTISAYKLLLERNPDLPLKLVVVGAYGWKSNDIKDAAKGIEDNIEWKGYVTDEELSLYYKNAYAVLFPSLAEGFGLPILEAMTNGVPVVTSNRSSMPEVGGTAACYCDPLDTESIAEAIESLLDNAFHQERSEASIMQAKQFTWERTAATTFSAITATLSSP